VCALVRSVPMFEVCSACVSGFNPAPKRFPRACLKLPDGKEHVSLAAGRSTMLALYAIAWAKWSMPATTSPTIYTIGYT